MNHDIYKRTTDPSTCHFSGAPCHPPGLRAGSFFDEQAIVEVSFLRSMLVRSSKRDHMLFTYDTIVDHIMSGIGKSFKMMGQVLTTVSSSVFTSQGVEGHTVLDLTNLSLYFSIL